MLKSLKDRWGIGERINTGVNTKGKEGAVGGTEERLERGREEARKHFKN